MFESNCLTNVWIKCSTTDPLWWVPHGRPPSWLTLIAYCPWLIPAHDSPLSPPGDTTYTIYLWVDFKHISQDVGWVCIWSLANIFAMFLMKDHTLLIVLWLNNDGRYLMLGRHNTQIDNAGTIPPDMTTVTQGPSQTGFTKYWQSRLSYCCQKVVFFANQARGN